MSRWDAIYRGSISESKDVIGPFDGQYNWLSNFYICHVPYNGLFYRNAEAAYQAQKTTDPEIREDFENLDPLKAKRKGRRLELRKDWEEMKVKIMKEVVKSKFMSNPDLRNKLIATGDADLVELNHWNDRTWGVCSKTNIGKNLLGKILMKLRREI